MAGEALQRSGGFQTSLVSQHRSRNSQRLKSSPQTLFAALQLRGAQNDNHKVATSNY